MKQTKSLILYMLWIAGFSLLSACGGTQRQEERAEGVAMDSIQVEKVCHLFDNPENPNCNLVIHFVYPKDTMLQHAFVASYFGDEYLQYAPEEAVRRYTEDYLANYKELEETFRKDVEENETPGAWYSYYEMSSNVIRYNAGGLLSYTVYFENYTGGAHGAHSYTNFTLDTKTGKRVTEADLFVEDYQDMLAQLLVREITRKNNVPAASELENIGYFSVDEIYPNNNFYIDGTGLTYTFNEYEIAAYTIGATEVHLTFEQLAPILKPKETTE